MTGAAAYPGTLLREALHRLGVSNAELARLMRPEGDSQAIESQRIQIQKWLRERMSEESACKVVAALVTAGHQLELAELRDPGTAEEAEESIRAVLRSARDQIDAMLALHPDGSSPDSP